MSSREHYWVEEDLRLRGMMRYGECWVGRMSDWEGHEMGEDVGLGINDVGT